MGHRTSALGGTIELKMFQPVFYSWCNKGRGMYYHICRMVHITDFILPIGKNAL